MFVLLKTESPNTPSIYCLVSSAYLFLRIPITLLMHDVFPSPLSPQKANILGLSSDGELSNDSMTFKACLYCSLKIESEK